MSGADGAGFDPWGFLRSVLEAGAGVGVLGPALPPEQYHAKLDGLARRYAAELRPHLADPPTLLTPEHPDKP